MHTVADVLKRIERIKKDLEYVRTFQDKWRDQRDRFPKIYEGILEQERAFLRKIEELRNLKVEPLPGEPLGADDVSAAAQPAVGVPAGAALDDDAFASKPRVSAPLGADGHGGPNGDGTPRVESSDEKRAAAAGEAGAAGERFRKLDALLQPK